MKTKTAILAAAGDASDGGSAFHATVQTETQLAEARLAGFSDKHFEALLRPRRRK